MMKPDEAATALVFVGRVTASLSHQINNVLGAINELSGLVDDRLLLAEQGRPIDFEGMHRTRSEIEAQVRRGKETIRTLNRFAHSLDEPVAKVDLAATLGLVASFTERFGQLREVGLAIDLPETAIEFTCSPSILEQLVFEVILAAIEPCEAGQAVALGLETTGSTPVVTVASDAAPDSVESTSAIANARRLAAEMGASIEVARQGNGSVIRVTLSPGGDAD